MFEKIGRQPITSLASTPSAAAAPASRFTCEEVSPADTFAAAGGHDLRCACAAHGKLLPLGASAESSFANAAMAGSAAAFAPPVPVAELKPLIEARIDKLFEVYKDLHMNPELSGQEVRTRGIVGERLKALGYEVTENFGKYPDGKELQSVIAICKNGPGPTLLVRADMDALPIIEKTGVPYASTKKVQQPDGSTVGVMHACGHDIHTTNLMGFADLMMQLKDRWSGTLMLVAQPAEENLGGAKRIMEAGLYEKFGTPDAAIGMHAFGAAAPDTIATRVGPMMAAVDSIDVTLHGRGAHGSSPHSAIDPVVMLGNFIVQANQIVSRNVSPGTPALVTIGQVQAGTARNIIPAQSLAKVTVRSFDEKVQKNLLDAVTRTAKGVSVTAGAPREPDIVKVQDTYPVVINEAALTNGLTGMWQRELASENIKVREMPAFMGGEDFPYYAKADRSIPTTFFFVGTTPQAELDRRAKEGLPPPSAHTEDYLPDAVPTLRTALLAVTTAATSFLAPKQ